MVLPVIGQGFVKLSVLLLGNVVRVTSPDRLSLVQLLVLFATYQRHHSAFECTHFFYHVYTHAAHFKTNL